MIDDDLDDSITAILGGNEAGINREKLWKRVVDEVLEFVKAFTDQPYGKSLIQIVDSFGAFPKSGQDYVYSKVINPLVESVQDAIKTSEVLRSNKDLQSLKKKNHLNKVEWVIKQLEEVSDEEDYRYQAIANAYVEEICVCSILAFNEFDDIALAQVLINWADSLPSFGHIKTKLNENKEALKDLVKSRAQDEIYKEIIQQIEVELRSIAHASTILDSMKTELTKIRAKIGRRDEGYIKVSSVCVKHILEFLIETVNNAQTVFASTRNLDSLRVTVSQANLLTHKLATLDMDATIRTHLNKNTKVIQEMNTNLTLAASGQQSTPNETPGWVWLIIVFILFWVFFG